MNLNANVLRHYCLTRQASTPEEAAILTAVLEPDGMDWAGAAARLQDIFSAAGDALPDPAILTTVLEPDGMNWAGAGAGAARTVRDLYALIHWGPSIGGARLHYALKGHPAPVSTERAVAFLQDICHPGHRWLWHRAAQAYTRAMEHFSVPRAGARPLSLLTVDQAGAFFLRVLQTHDKIAAAPNRAAVQAIAATVTDGRVLDMFTARGAREYLAEQQKGRDPAFLRWTQIAMVTLADALGHEILPGRAPLPLEPTAPIDGAEMSPADLLAVEDQVDLAAAATRAAIAKNQPKTFMESVNRRYVSISFLRTTYDLQRFYRNLPAGAPVNSLRYSIYHPLIDPSDPFQVVAADQLLARHADAAQDIADAQAFARARQRDVVQVRTWDWSHLNLAGLDLQRLDFAQANLSGSILVGADLTGAKLTQANLRDAVMDEDLAARLYAHGDQPAGLVVVPVQQAFPYRGPDFRDPREAAARPASAKANPVPKAESVAKAKPERPILKTKGGKRRPPKTIIRDTPPAPDSKSPGQNKVEREEPGIEPASRRASTPSGQPNIWTTSKDFKRLSLEDLRRQAAQARAEQERVLVVDPASDVAPGEIQEQTPEAADPELVDSELADLEPPDFDTVSGQAQVLMNVPPWEKGP